jgi:hypothetical protein
MSDTEQVQPQAMQVVADGLSVATMQHERRQSRRMPYSSIGAVAPYLPPDIPPEEAFWMIRCRDLSRRGVAFYSPIKPSTASLVIRLGVLDGNDCLIACRLAHCSYVSNSGSPQYLVGCEFVERLHGSFALHPE